MGRYFEEFAIGDAFVSMGRTITDGDIDAFIALTGDDNRLHSDNDFAQASGFQGRIAHGALVLSLAVGLAWQTGMLVDTTRAFREVTGWKFIAPGYPGDTIRMIVTVAEVKAYPRLRTGAVIFEATVRNEREEQLCKGTLNLLMAMRPQISGDTSTSE